MTDTEYTYRPGHKPSLSSTDIRKIVTDALAGSFLSRPQYKGVSMQVVMRINDGNVQVKARPSDDAHGAWTYLTITVKREM